MGNKMKTIPITKDPYLLQTDMKDPEMQQQSVR